MPTIDRDALIDARALAAVAARLVFDATAGASLTPLQAERHRKAVNLLAAAAVALDELLAVVCGPGDVPDDAPHQEVTP